MVTLHVSESLAVMFQARKIENALQKQDSLHVSVRDPGRFKAPTRKEALAHCARFFNDICFELDGMIIAERYQASFDEPVIIIESNGVVEQFHFTVRRAPRTI